MLLPSNIKAVLFDMDGVIFDTEDLYTDFLNKFGQSSALLVKDNSHYIDLAEINRQTLVKCGVKPHNIIVSDICTCCNTDLLYSHRGQGPQRGIFASFLQLN